MLTISHTGGPEADERSVQIPAKRWLAEKLQHLSTGAGFQAPEVFGPNMLAIYLNIWAIYIHLS